MGESREKVQVSGRLIMRRSTDGASVGMRLCEIIWVVTKMTETTDRVGFTYLQILNEAHTILFQCQAISDFGTLFGY